VTDDDTVPRVVIGFIVCNLIEDFLNIACVFPAKEGIYNYNYDRMVLSLKIIWGALFFFVVSNICFIIYSSHYPDRTVFDNVFLAINLAVGILVYISLIISSRSLFRTLIRIRQIKESLAARVHVNI
jgi:hypothetical protein